MVTPGDPALRFPFSVTFIRSIVGSKRVRTGGCITMTGPPGPPVRGNRWRYGNRNRDDRLPHRDLRGPDPVCPSDCPGDDREGIYTGTAVDMRVREPMIFRRLAVSPVPDNTHDSHVSDPGSTIPYMVQVRFSMTGVSKIRSGGGLTASVAFSRKR